MELPDECESGNGGFDENLGIEHFDGGGFSIGGVIVAPYCNILVILMSVVFLIGGILLTIIAFMDGAQVRVDSNLVFGVEERKFAGPLLILIGTILFNLGIFLSFISCKAAAKKNLNPNIINYDTMGSTVTEESFFSILPSDSNTPRLIHPCYIPQHSLDEGAAPDLIADVAVKVEELGAIKSTEEALQIQPHHDQSTFNNNEQLLLHDLQRYNKNISRISIFISGIRPLKCYKILLLSQIKCRLMKIFL